VNLRANYNEAQATCQLRGLLGKIVAGQLFGYEITYRRVIGRSGANSTDDARRKLPIVSIIPGTDWHGSCEFQWNFPQRNTY